MNLRELSGTSAPELARGAPCVLTAFPETAGESAGTCVESLLAHTAGEIPFVLVTERPGLFESAGRSASRIWTLASVDSAREGDLLTSAVNRALGLLAGADIVLLSEPCRVATGWLDRMREAALSDTNTASASALTDTGTPLAIVPHGSAATDINELADGLRKRTLALRPRLELISGPCVYLRGDALQLVGLLDAHLPLIAAVEVDFAQRCVLTGLHHLVADDVVVERLAPSSAPTPQPPRSLRERYPYLYTPPSVCPSAMLASALRAARPPSTRLPITLDARALNGELTGTRLHVRELVHALADTDAVSLRLLVSCLTQEAATQLRELPGVELHEARAPHLETAPRTPVFHRPQQAFSPEDVRFAFALGERVVLSQLDMIGYRNPGYFTDGDSWVGAQRATRQGLAAAERIIVFSEHTRRELISDALAADERIRVVAPGLDHQAAGEPRRPRALDGWLASGAGGDHDRYLLCLGTDFRHKNRLFALRLLGALREHHGWQGGLILAGAHIPHGSSRELERDLMQRDPALGNAVLQLGAVSEEEKDWLFAHAAAVVYPSTYEGFGLVPFEASLRGVPCLFAAQSSLADVAPAETATIVPWDPVQSAAAAHPLLSDPTARRRHVHMLASVAHELTWAKCAERLVDVYAEAAQAPVREAATVSYDAARRERELLDFQRDLVEAHDQLVASLVAEREHAKGMYDALNTEVGAGLSLIGPHGALPDEVQRALLALSARPTVSRPLYTLVSRAFTIARSVARRNHGRHIDAG